MVTGGTPAWSDTYNHRDAAHDVAGTPKGGFDYHRARANRKFDVTHVQVLHSNTQIRMDVKLRSTSMKSVKWRTFNFKMKTNIDTFFGSWQQYHGEYQFDVWNDATGQDISCGSMRNGTHDRTLTISFDRSCVGNPRWIRVGVSVSGHRHDDRAFYDVAQSNSWKAQDYKLTRRLHPSA